MTEARIHGRARWLGLGLGFWLAWSGALGSAAAQARLDGVELDPAPAEILGEILEAARLPSARVSSYTRTARKQAEIMYQICARKGGVAKARRTYSAAARRIIDVFVAARKERLGKDATIELMTGEVRAILADLGAERTTLMHVESDNYTFDVAPSSIRDRRRFAAAIQAHPEVIRVLLPGVGSERAYHIEVSRDLAPVTGSYAGHCDGGGEPVASEFVLAKADAGYRGRLRIAGETSEWPVVVDRRSGSIYSAGAGEGAGAGLAGFFLVGRFSPGHGILTIPLGPMTCTLARASL